MKLVFAAAPEHVFDVFEQRDGGFGSGAFHSSDPSHRIPRQRHLFRTVALAQGLSLHGPNRTIQHRFQRAKILRNQRGARHQTGENCKN